MMTLMKWKLLHGLKLHKEYKCTTKMKMKGPMDLYLDPELIVKRRRREQQKIDKNGRARKGLRNIACKAFARSMNDAGIPFNVINYPSFIVWAGDEAQLS